MSPVLGRVGEVNIFFTLATVASGIVMNALVAKNVTTEAVQDMLTFFAQEWSGTVRNDREYT